MAESDAASATAPAMDNTPVYPAHTSSKKPVCRFYTSKNGCRAGNQCRFQHIAIDRDMEKTPPTPLDIAEPSLPGNGKVSSSNATPKPVARPIPKAQVDDPRAFQLGQIQRRYKPEPSEDKNGNAVLKFKLEPSDPDFPYDIDALECVLTVPPTYPISARPTLLVKNVDIPRGFQINIERGFDSIAAEGPNITLLGLMNRLDRQLESILAGKKAETIKIVSNRATAKQSVVENAPKSPAKEMSNEHSVPVFTDQDLAEAQIKRQSHTRQLEARFSRMQPFVKSSDGLIYTVPLDSPKRSSWPANLQSVRSVRLRVPQRYPLEPAEAHFDLEGPEVSAVELSFRARSLEHPNATLTQQINYLSQNLNEMAIPPFVQAEERLTRPEKQPTPVTAPVERDSRTTTAASRPIPANDEQEDTHLHYIPRPPEWDNTGHSSDSIDEESTSDDTASDEDDPDADNAETTEASASTAPAEKGILLSFPHLELHGIELLELTSLNITVKCERCKDTMDVGRLRSSGENSEMRVESCKKCAAAFAFRFRADMIHANAVRAGYLDLEGCTIVDMLQSSFIPTCAECSTSVPAPGVVAVRGDSALAVCRECHKKLSFRIVEVKFLRISASAARASLAPGRRKARENLGITAGTELPQRGRCRHYRKSYRWFRFSCCSRVWPCDRCHDEKEDHPNEWANRMLCGYCSREQNYNPESCVICHASLVGKRGRGFWEGGEGTRDPRKMSRKDPRKYKRKPGTKPKK